ncbi:MAG: LysR family transcriptional regulator [Deltaproteobacteria bacterium]|nr:LysR family transcriptional regulator [Deltaproteobacteria bacterium]
MELAHLRTFCLVAQKGGLRQAAYQLKLTPAAVSIRLKRLEAYTGTKLFDHAPNRLTLTEDGRTFLDEVQRILGDLDSSISLLHERKGLCAGNISVALGSDMAFFLAPAIAAFAKDNPMVRLSILARPSPDTLALVTKNQAEIGIGRFTALPTTLRRIPLFRSGLVAIYPRKHPLSAHSRLSLSSLASHELILLTSQAATRQVINRVFFENGLEIKTVIEAGSCFAIKEYVRLGLGVGLVHDTCVVEAKERHVHVSNLGHLFGKFEVSLIYLEKKNLPLAHRRFIEAIGQIKNPLAPKRF